MSDEHRCPVCGGPSARVADLTRCNGACGLTLESADFARLSEAAQVLRACEQIEKHLGSEHDSEGFPSHALNVFTETWGSITIELLNNGEFITSRSGDTLTEALLRLSEDVRRHAPE